jgi:aminoglycoside 3-N-acetyltransferase
MWTRKDLTSQLSALGVRSGDVVMVHASLRAIGEVAGGPDEVHLAIKDAVGPDGTMFMYAGCPAYVDEVGRGNLTAEQEAEVLEKLPAFDPYTARSARDNGALVELFRTYPGSRVNAHPARFVVWGKQTDNLLSHQPWDFAFGRGTLFERFVELDGKILLLGSDHDNVTFLHYAEHVGDFPDKRIARFLVPILEHGRKVWKKMAEVDTSDGAAHANWPDGLFATIVDELLYSTNNVGGHVGGAKSYLIDAKRLLELAESIMRAVALDVKGSAKRVTPDHQ